MLNHSHIEFVLIIFVAQGTDKFEMLTKKCIYINTAIIG